MRKTHGDLERTCADPDLRPDRHVAWAGAVVDVREVTVAIAQVDLHVRGPVVAGGCPAEGPDDADPDVLLAHEQRRRIRIQNLPEVALGSRLPVSRGLHVQANVGKLGRERRGNEEGVLLRVGEKLLGEAVFVVGAVDSESGHARTHPRDAVLAVGCVIDRRRTAGGGEEAQLVKRDAIQEREENLAERPVRERVPELAPRTRRCSKRHFAAGTPHGRRAWSSWSFHRALSMESG